MVMICDLFFTLALIFSILKPKPDFEAGPFNGNSKLLQNKVVKVIKIIKVLSP